MDIIPENTGEKQDSRFVKGQSGNPSGRPKGALNHTTRAAIALLDGEIEAVTRKAIELALAGDMQAIKLVLERTIPVRKERPINIELPEINDISDIAEAHTLVIKAVSNGDITSSEGQTLLAFLDKAKKTFKDDAIDQALPSFW
jgi:hypothetical protein